MVARSDWDTMQTTVTDLQGQVQTLQGERRAGEIQAAVDSAVENRQIDISEREAWTQRLEGNYELMAPVLAGLRKQTDMTGQKGSGAEAPEQAPAATGTVDVAAMATRRLMRQGGPTSITGGAFAAAAGGES